MKASRLFVQYDYDFDLIGIVSPLKEYTLAWEINRLLKINLKKEPDAVYETARGRKFLISNYLFRTESSVLRLLKNKALDFDNVLNPFLVPEMKEYDYFFLSKTDVPDRKGKNALRLIKALDNVQYASLIVVGSLKSRDNLIF